MQEAEQVESFDKQVETSNFVPVLKNWQEPFEEQSSGQDLDRKRQEWLEQNWIEEGQSESTEQVEFKEEEEDGVMIGGGEQRVLSSPVLPTKPSKHSPQVFETDWQFFRFNSLQFGAEEQSLEAKKVP